MQTHAIPALQASGEVLQSRASRLATASRGRPPKIPRARAPIFSDDMRSRLDSVAARFEQFITRVQPRRSPATIQWYRNAFAVFRIYLEDAGELAPDAFDERIRNLDGFADWNLSRGVSPIATNTYWRALRAFFNDWEQYDGVPNPYRIAKAPGFDPPEPKALHHDDCTRILLAALNYRRWDTFQRARAAAVIGVMLYAGLRKSEALALTVSEVNFKTNEIHVVHGKGQWGGKKRRVPIAPDLARLLHAYLRERAKRRITDEAPEFFSSTRSTGSMGTTTLAVIIRTLVRASGVPFSAHMLRHSFVTHLLGAGVPLHVARDLAGHSHIETTLGYTKVFSKERHDNVAKLRFW